MTVGWATLASENDIAWWRAPQTRTLLSMLLIRRLPAPDNITRNVARDKLIASSVGQVREGPASYLGEVSPLIGVADCAI